ncbi:hypothetical protein CK203_099917 [Vitis vinifera]|uniref:Uncharacterized protein n=1 Tax=Vitis vinifera TaxID=29760 RepID=A0A438CER4_VITVI|nr:hypothetical protein CK203_099917 [Vitis vinifera]
MGDDFHERAIETCGKDHQLAMVVGGVPLNWKSMVDEEKGDVDQLLGSKHTGAGLGELSGVEEKSEQLQSLENSTMVESASALLTMALALDAMSLVAEMDGTMW